MGNETIPDNGNVEIIKNISETDLRSMLEKTNSQINKTEGRLSLLNAQKNVIENALIEKETITQSTKDRLNTIMNTPNSTPGGNIGYGAQAGGEINGGSSGITTLKGSIPGSVSPGNSGGF